MVSIKQALVRKVNVNDIRDSYERNFEVVTEWHKDECDVAIIKLHKNISLL